MPAVTISVWPSAWVCHAVRAPGSNVTQEELIETITHLAFYAGWPAAMTAGRIARKVFDG